ncbi:c-type cytochrome [Polynucleobacter sp. AP-Reno-20A-A9]|uniref:c-type cytochrome n=1 Tax=Polynucleobacter sp. AP-Reno-20A-A9 TaxID=2576925 RepID=UPI002107F2A2|nr:c-type cytochrome [Polynucleobacter sp. AP-Reno-20A-A9]
MLKKRVDVKVVFLFATLAYFMPVAHANAEDEKAFAIAKQNACLGCHAINKKIVGPSFQSVAEKYKNDPNAQTFLKNKIAKGGSGSWGVVPMPANSKLSNADLSTLSGWILRGAP